MRRRSDGGFSLIEVVIALGLLAGVLITIYGLFIIGDRQVKSGRTSSEALSVARTILEEMNRWGFRQTYQTFDSTYDGTVQSYSIDSRTNAFAAKWQATLDEKLVNSRATIEIQSLGPASVPPNLNVTRAMRVLVTVFWDEGQRHRSVRVGTVRM